ncbi:unnamed protein product [Didymodactylos carnosus]|uniref:Fibronectin type-III domain-containing protein n=1 Tax=Didymodactylos carnosus TaxID=1234261 RepID=A0A8S2GSX0_9BILA|nr:unnamed protein product [Didymodactylos carnosus]CAF3557505.1 unnamed protein product [Didymodactylos carnosus]
MIYVVRGQLALTNLTAYIANAHMMSVTWDLPPNLNAIDKVFITIEDVESNRTIQMQSFDNSIKKLDIQIKANDAYSVQPNRTIRFSARCSDRNGQNSTTTVYQMYINMKDPAPLNVRVFRVNDTSINVTWDPISYPEVSRYTVYYNDKSETKDIEKWPLYALSPHTSSALISDLKPDVIYNIRVNAEFIVRKDSIQTGFYPGRMSEIYVADVYRSK